MTKSYFCSYLCDEDFETEIPCNHCLIKDLRDKDEVYIEELK